jgi:hypothetical protein
VSWPAFLRYPLLQPWRLLSQSNRLEISNSAHLLSRSVHKDSASQGCGNVNARLSQCPVSLHSSGWPFDNN